MNNSLGIIGSGRVAHIILGAFKNSGKFPEKVVVSDINQDNLNKLKEKFPEIEISFNDNSAPAKMKYVLIGLHPHLFGEGLKSISDFLNKDSIIVSLAPKVKIKSISEILNGKNKIMKLLPNAPTVVNSGYNPITFDETFTEDEKNAVKDFFSALGNNFETDEDNFEAYAVINAMGPTYFWFQFYKMLELSQKFGLSAEEGFISLENMITGALNTMKNEEFTPEQIMDLVALKPMAQDEETIKNIFEERLTGIFNKLKS